MLYNLVTGTIMVLIIRSGVLLIGGKPPRRVPWVAVALTTLVVAGLILQHTWGGALATLDNDPGRSGWWRPVTAVFMQNGGVVGAGWNLVTIAIVAALAEWFWGPVLTILLFAAGMFSGFGGHSTDPRNFVGSSGATYFLGATFVGAMLLSVRDVKLRLLALAVPALGLISFFVQTNDHGLVTAEGFAFGAVVWLVLHRWVAFNRDLVPSGR